jgi:ABC-type transport system involved in multi-copper enzyme maturation permease subunit
MFKTLMIKELHDSFASFRFWLVAGLCLLTIPLGFLIASKDYQMRLQESRSEENQYLEATRGRVNAGTRAEGYFAPSPLGILSAGFRDYLPYKAVTSRDGNAQTEKKMQESNVQSVLFGKIDFLFIVTNFLSLLALIFTFGSISTEKELGTMKLVLSNQVPRWKIILAKIFGNYLVFLVPFLIAVIIGLIVVQLAAGVNFLSGAYLGPLLIILFFTMIFLLMFFCLGIWASVISRSTVTSIVILLFVWAMISLGVPRMSPMLAQVLDPVKTEDIFQKEYQALKGQIEEELWQKRCEMMDRLVAENHIEVDFSREFPDFGRIAEQTKYDRLFKPIEEGFAQRMTKELNDLQNDYRRKRDHQMMIASNLSRISPVSSYSFLTTELCGTGLLELRNRQDAARAFQAQADSEIYSRYSFQAYALGDSRVYGNTEKKEWITRIFRCPS